ncbi:unnamed protein product [Rhizophagus irregularis]|nr:unnamed protein product [Rhizophagus irregularis]
MESSNASGIPQGKFEPSSEDYCSIATDKQAPACSNKFNVYCQREDCQIHVWCVSSLRAGVEEQICTRNEIGKYEDIGELPGFCTNRRAIKELQTSIGELRRVCVLGDAEWTGEEYRTKAYCYGRVFQWENMEQVLWPVGDSLEDVKSHEDLVVWTVEDGIVYEESIDSLKPRKTKGTKNNRSKKKKKR